MVCCVRSTFDASAGWFIYVLNIWRNHMCRILGMRAFHLTFTWKYIAAISNNNKIDGTKYCCGLIDRNKVFDFFFSLKAYFSRLLVVSSSHFLCSLAIRNEKFAVNCCNSRRMSNGVCVSGGRVKNLIECIRRTASDTSRIELSNDAHCLHLPESTNVFGAAKKEKREQNAFFHSSTYIV